jgi:hypothetical protein
MKLTNPLKKLKSPLKLRHPFTLKIKFRKDNFLIRFTHFIIYLNFVTGALYAALRVFTTPRADFVLRRMYALEAWIIIGFFSLYFALTNYPKIRISQE